MPKPKSPENTPKNAKNDNLLKTKRALKPKCKLSGGPVFCIYLAREGAIRPSVPVSYATGNAESCSLQ